MFGRRKEPPAPPPSPYPANDQPRLAPRSPSEAIKPAMAPPPPPRVRKPRGGLLSTLSGIFSLIAVLALSGLIGLVLIGREVANPGPLSADKVVVVPRNTGVGEIAELLQREGVIAHPYLFQLYARINQQRSPLKAGEFVFKAHASISDAVETLAEGKSILHSFTAPEGLTSEQIVARLRENDVLTGEVKEIPPEGSLLPDTYRFERGMTRQQLVTAMQRGQRDTLAQIWSRRAQDLPVKTPEELVILASIVEKETGRADERTRVAGVFINRLRKKMRLQSDPTIVYGLVGGKGTLGRGILRSEIDKPTPYNTYTIEGLPPGPIANPGRAALEAVANPSRTRDLFFVADGSGGHAFAETYEQHQRNVTRWRQIERTRDAGQQREDEVDRAQEPEVRGDVPATAPVREATAGGSVAGGSAAAGGSLADVSEGTERDPLLNTSYDLNSPKNVPLLEFDPVTGTASAAGAAAAKAAAAKAAKAKAAVKANATKPRKKSRKVEEKPAAPAE